MKIKNKIGINFAFKSISMLLVVCLILGVISNSTNAWEQPTHKLINGEAVKRFEKNHGKSNKYKDAKVRTDRVFNAPIVTTSGKFSMTYNQMWSSRSVKDHIIEGGFSADEPNIYVSVKHFYDPLALSGVHELTDQETAHGILYEAIPATKWAIYREDNPYCLKNAMNNYKKGMEIPYDAQIKNIPATGDFRDFEGSPQSIEMMRDMYIGKSMRGLGEVMHLVADMTQPAHVRNDSHPKYEITEQTLNESLSSQLIHGGRLDNLNLNDFGKKVVDIMHGVAIWTNANFYSMDTIADATMGLSPNNGEIPYSLPNLSNMEKKIYERNYTWFSKFNGQDIPIVRRRIGVIWDSWEITPSMAKEQGRVLIPLAVSACAYTMDSFFPTLKIKQTVKEEEPFKEFLDEALGKGAEDIKQYLFSANLEHLKENDPQWNEFNLSINYSGPGQLWIVRNKKHDILCEVEFVGGKIVAYKDPGTGEIVEEDIRFWMPLGASKKITVGEISKDFMVDMEDAVYCVAYAGAQELRSPDYVFELNSPKITLEADKTVLMPGEKVEFTATIEDAPERYKLEWTFGDEEDDEKDIKPPTINRNKTMTHLYEREDEYVAKVRLIDTKRKIVRAEDSIDISSYMGELAGPWKISMLIEEENTFFKAIIVGIMKFITNLIIMPIIRAIGGEEQNIDKELESFTFVGSEMIYEMDLRKNEEYESVYEGPIVAVEIEDSFISGSDEIYAVRLEIVKGKIVIYAKGIDEDGVEYETEFLKNGKMTSPGVIEGDFNFTGAFSGTWTATMN